MARNPVTQSVDETAFDDYYRTLSHEWRRITVDVLATRSSMSVEALAEDVATRTTRDTTPERIETSLQHRHLPRLVDVGAVEFDGERVVTLHPVFDRLTQLLHPVAT